MYNPSPYKNFNVNESVQQLKNISQSVNNTVVNRQQAGSLYQNSRMYRYDRTPKKVLNLYVNILDMGDLVGTDTSFDLKLDEPLIIDKLSDSFPILYIADIITVA